MIFARVMSRIKSFISEPLKSLDETIQFLEKLIES